MTAWVRATCQEIVDTYLPDADVVTSEFWLVTPPQASSPGMEEWVETGISSGFFLNSSTGSTSDAFNVFFWSRNYYIPSVQIYNFDEYPISGTPTPGLDYVLTIKFVSGTGSGTGWRIFKGSVDVGGGGATNAPPGASQMVQAGAESANYVDGNQGAVSHLSDVQSGVTHSGLTGYIFQSPEAYTYTTGGSTDLTFHTPNAVHCNL